MVKSGSVGPGVAVFGMAIVLLAVGVYGGAVLTPEIQAALNALAATPGFGHLTTYRSIVNRVGAQIKVAPGTILAPSDAALKDAISKWPRFFGKVTEAINMHILTGVRNITQLQALPLNSVVATFATSTLRKASAAGLAPARFKSLSVRFTANTTIVRTVFVGKTIAVYGVDTVLVPP